MTWYGYPTVTVDPYWNTNVTNVITTSGEFIVDTSDGTYYNIRYIDGDEFVQLPVFNRKLFPQKGLIDDYALWRSAED